MAYFTFLFNAAVWGTVSDWLMVVVTLATAFYLYKTLKSQKEVQLTQTKLFEIESIRFKESIKPKLAFRATREMFKNGDEVNDILSFEVTNETTSMALDIKREMSERGDVKQIAIPLGFDSIRDHSVKGDPPLLFHFLIGANKINYLNFTLSYQDIAGTKYKQGVFCIADHIGIEVNPYLPELIS
jgi:hypothetical protein